MKNKQKTVGRFRGKLVKMIKDIGSKFDDYSFSPKNRQIFFVNWILDNNLGWLVSLIFAKTNTLPALTFVKNKFCFYSV